MFSSFRFTGRKVNLFILEVNTKMLRIIRLELFPPCAAMMENLPAIYPLALAKERDLIADTELDVLTDVKVSLG